MKKRLRFLSMLLVLPVVFIACGGGGDDEPPATSTLNSGLVAYYPFSGNANDASGNGNNGTVNGAVLTPDRNGKADSAYSTLAGYIQVPHSASLNVTNFTLALWFRMETLSSAFSCLIGKDYSTSYAIGIDSGGSGVCPAPGGVVRVMRVYVADKEYRFTLSDFSCDTWYHVSVTYDNASGAVQLFVNGTPTPLQSGMIAAGSAGATTFPLGIGRDGKNTDAFRGKVDEVRIYNRVLSSSEIQELYSL